MAGGGIRWTARDRYGNDVYLTDERWRHITESWGHPEMAQFEDELRETVRAGDRQQDSLNPEKYRYVKEFDDLPEHNTHIVAVVLFKSIVSEGAKSVPNNFVVTAYQKEVT
ncbi:MAG TPA: hypothetical protein VEK15_23200 [Vicinamibacteria bacterium]|nr:hypothetical protein [Vicinamibacteria bacterium]